MKLSLKKWAENEFKNDPELNLIPTFYNTLRNDGQDFTDTTQNASTTKQSLPAIVNKDPYVVSSQQEEDDIAKAIELSLKDKGGSPKPTSTATAVSNFCFNN